MSASLHVLREQVHYGWSRDFAEARRMAVEDMLEIVQACLHVGAGEALMLISALGDLRVGQASMDTEMTVRLEMPRRLGLRAVPGARGAAGGRAT